MELSLRLIGKRPYEAPLVQTTVKPANYGCTHPQLGFSLNPGTYCFDLSGEIQFCARHTQDSLRATSSIAIDSPKKEIHLYGCSLTYGYGIADSQTFAWRMQDHFADWEIRNYGVSAYGLTQMFERMKLAYSQGRRPDLVIFAYASFHDERNAMMRNWRKSLTSREKDFVGGTELEVPYHRVKKNRIWLGKTSLKWKAWPFMKQSALVHAIDRSWSDWEFSLVKTRIISFALVRKIQRWCQQRDIPLFIAAMDQNEYTLRAMSYFRSLDILTVDLAIDYRLCGMTFMPLDPHPTALAHKHFAETLIAYLEAKKIL